MKNPTPRAEKTRLFDLFLAFFKLGLFTFGGGYAMISLIRDKALVLGWLTEEELLNMIAISESTPGPIAVNMATFVGSMQGGILGSLVATLGVVLPSFVIILLICSVIRNFMHYKGVKAFLSGARPAVIGLMLATGITMLLSTLFGFTNIAGSFNVDYRAIAIFVILIVTALLSKKLIKKKPSPIMMIIISAGLGMLFYSI
jgi:chromate transporter